MKPVTGDSIAPLLYNGSDGLLATEEQMRRLGQQTGWIQRRGEKWHIFYREFVGLDESGEVKWRQTSRVVGFASGPERMSKAAALAKGREQYVIPANGVTSTPGGLCTVQQFVDTRFRPDHIQKKREGTSADYESLLRLHILPAIGHCQLRDVSRAMVQTILNAKDRSGLSSQRVAHIRNLMSALFRHARRMNFITGELPTYDVIIPEVKAEERPPLNEIQMDLLLGHVGEFRLRVAMRLMARLGLRAGEMAGLRWECVNLTDEAQWLHGEVLAPHQMWVREQYSRNKFSECKTAKSNRRIPLPADLVTMLVDWKAKAKFAKAADTVFASRDGRPLDHHNVLKRTIKPAALKAGVPWASWHNLRHTAATAADQVMSPSESMALLGHTSPRMTTKYTHPSQQTLRKRLEEMATNGVKN